MADTDFSGYGLQDWRRFFSKIEPTADIKSEHVTTPCWHWVGSISDSGYGTFQHPDGRTMRAHREAYKFCIGPIPKGHVLMHLCDNPVCVNPFHHVTGTPQENMLDMVKKGRNRNQSTGKLGEDNSRASFTDREVRRIKLEYSHGYTPSRLAKKYKRPLSTIKDIVYGKTWTHVEIRSRDVQSKKTKKKSGIAKRKRTSSSRKKPKR